MDKFEGRLTRDGIRIHNPGDFAGMHKAGALAARILDDIAAMVEPGVTTEAIDAEIERLRAAGERVERCLNGDGHDFSNRSRRLVRQGDGWTVKNS